jgi:hypothetical protein
LTRGASNPDYLAPVTRYLVHRKNPEFKTKVDADKVAVAPDQSATSRRAEIVDYLGLCALWYGRFPRTSISRPGSPRFRLSEGRFLNEIVGWRGQKRASRE